MNKLLKELGTSMGFLEKGNIMYGVFKDFTVTLYNELGLSGFFINAAMPGDQYMLIREDLKNYIQSRKSVYKYTSFIVNEHGITMSFQATLVLSL